MPPKIRKLKSDLQKAGFIARPAKGSHTVWFYPPNPSIEVTLAGNDGNDAKPYQMKEVRNALKEAKETN